MLGSLLTSLNIVKTKFHIRYYLFVDHEKAFDSVEWNFLVKCQEEFDNEVPFWHFYTYSLRKF